METKVKVENGANFMVNIWSEQNEVENVFVILQIYQDLNMVLNERD